MSKPNGGSAFPSIGRQVDAIVENNWYSLKEGMTLRQWYAGQALSHVHAFAAIYDLVEQCFKIADAMIEYEEKGGK